MSGAFDRSVEVEEESVEAAVACYEELIEGWNDRDGDRFAAPFAADGTALGFDGSEMRGRDEIAAELNGIFADHETAAYVAKVKSVRLLGPDAALLRAIVGMIPAGELELEPDKNAHQTVVAAKDDDEWRIVLLQNTPAQFHGRPELASQMTDELREVSERA